MTDLERIPVHLPNDPVDEVVPVGHAESMALHYMTSAIDVMAKLVEANTDDIEGLARTHLLAKQVKRRLDLLIELVRPHLIAAMGTERQLDLDGIGRLERKTGVTRTGWDHDDVRRLIRREAVTRTASEDGEIDVHVMSAIDTALDLVWSVVAKGSYTATGLRQQLGIQPDEVSQTKWGDQTITITGASK